MSTKHRKKTVKSKPKIKKITEEQIDNIIRMDNMYDTMNAMDYFFTIPKKLFNTIEYSNVDHNIEDFFIDKGFELLGFTQRDDTDGRTSVFCKDDFFVKINKSREDMKCTFSLSFSTDTLDYVLEELKADISKFKSKKDEKPTFGVIQKDPCAIGNELMIKHFEMTIPPNLDLKINYGSEFYAEHRKIVKKLENETSGLFIFHGTSGCGKSTYIKNLAQEVKNKKFVYIPEFMVSALNEPTLMELLIEHKNSIIVIEDAEKVITQRDKSHSSLVSVLLNISDGILSDILKTPIIMTYNTKTENIDSALLRKGRLKYMHEFKTLKLEDVKKILKRNGASKDEIDNLVEDGKIKNEMTIADVFNLKEDIGNIKKDDDVKKIPLGFGG